MGLLPTKVNKAPSISQSARGKNVDNQQTEPKQHSYVSGNPGANVSGEKSGVASAAALMVNQSIPVEQSGNQEELHDDLWPPCTSLLKHLAYSTTLGEVPNYPEHLSRTVASMGHSRSIFRFKKNDPRQYLHDPNDLTKQDSFYCIYKGGLHGPQNGFRLVVAMAGVKPKFASEGLNGLGDIVRDTADLVCFTEDDGMEVVRSLDDGLEGANRVTARTVKIISDVTDEDVVQTVGPDEGAIQKKIQKAVYPPDTMTGRGCLLILQPRKTVMLVKPGVLPERAAKAAFDAQVGQESEETRFIIVEAAGTYIYSTASDVPIFFPANPGPILC